MAKSKNQDGQPRRPRKSRTKTGGAIVRLTPTVAGAVYDGVSFDDWDDEELMRGRRRNKNGKFTGRPPLVVAASMFKELNRRRFSRAYDLMASSLVDGALMLRSIVNDQEAPPADRIKAAELMFDRVLGKPKESIALDFAASAGLRGPAPGCAQAGAASGPVLRGRRRGVWLRALVEASTEVSAGSKSP